MYDTVEMQIITSPRRYAIMHSTAPRFREQTTGTTAPFGTYDVERPMTRAMSPKRYYTFNSSTHRSNPANKGVRSPCSHHTSHHCAAATSSFPSIP